MAAGAFGRARNYGWAEHSRVQSLLGVKGDQEIEPAKRIYFNVAFKDIGYSFSMTSIHPVNLQILIPCYTCDFFQQISLALFSTCLVLALSPSNAAPLLQTTQDPMASSGDRSPDRPHCPPYAQSNESEGSEVIKINYQIFLTDFSKKFTHSRLVKVFCRTGYFLAVNDEKKVTGTVNTSSNRSK